MDSQSNCSLLMRISIVPISHHPFPFLLQGLVKHGWIYKRECVSWGILDSSHTPVRYKIEFKGGNSPLVLCQQRPVGPHLPFNQRLEVRALRCLCALMFRKKGKGKTARVSTQIQSHEIAYASKCVCVCVCVCLCVCVVFGYTLWGQLYIQQK